MLLRGVKHLLRQRQHRHFTTGTSKPRVVVVGTGWGGFEAAKTIDKDKYSVHVVSPSNHFLFTPLLPSTAVGTVEFRCIQEPVRTIPGLEEYHQAKVRDIDFDTNTVVAEDIFSKHRFNLAYDKLVLATGVKTNTFQTPGVMDHEGRCVFFLKHLYHARMIRNRLLECFERASTPRVGAAERERLLSFCIVGGGPTSCEFAAELHDFLHDDVSRWFPQLTNDIKITLVEAGPSLLGAFDHSLRKYAMDKFQGKGIALKLGVAVQSVVHEPRAVLHAKEQPEWQEWQGGRTVAKMSDGTELPFGTLVWSAGLAPVKLLSSMDNLEKDRSGRLVVDQRLRVKGKEGSVWAIGDCAVQRENPLPQLAQAAQQQGKYVAEVLNGTDELGSGTPPFEIFSLGAMASLGFGDAVLDATKLGDISSGDKTYKVTKMKGLLAFLAWRASYLGKQVSWSNKLLIPMHWFKSWAFGRDISRF